MFLSHICIMKISTRTVLSLDVVTLSTSGSIIWITFNDTKYFINAIKKFHFCYYGVGAFKKNEVNHSTSEQVTVC